jgi:hypothetical protein
VYGKLYLMNICSCFLIVNDVLHLDIATKYFLLSESCYFLLIDVNDGFMVLALD